MLKYEFHYGKLLGGCFYAGWPISLCINQEFLVFAYFTEDLNYRICINEIDMSSREFEENLKKIEPLEEGRIENIRKRLADQLKESAAKDAVDKNRFEQEVLYYLEKMDVTEEKVRLRSHCLYFLDTMKEPQSNGKKIGFITQEMGREINTLGAKANDAVIQKFVVQMKDELEKIKELMMNIL